MYLAVFSSNDEVMKTTLAVKVTKPGKNVLFHYSELYQKQYIKDSISTSNILQAKFFHKYS